MLTGLPLIVLGWLMIMPREGKRRGLMVLGGLIVTAGMLSIVQAYN